MPIELAPDSQDLFGGDASESLRAQIAAAKTAPHAELPARLWQLQERNPSCLPLYYLLYKLHAGRRELPEAERAAQLGLAEAGRQCGLPLTAAMPAPVQRAQVDFAVNGPARFWLFTVKALAFIRLRRGQLHEAQQLLGWIEACDPAHSVGSDVTLALLRGAQTA